MLHVVAPVYALLLKPKRTGKKIYIAEPLSINTTVFRLVLRNNKLTTSSSIADQSSFEVARKCLGGMIAALRSSLQKVVEYAMEAIGNAGSAIGILAKDGVVLIGEKKVTSKLLQTSTSTEKMYKIDDHVPLLVSCQMPTSSSTQRESKPNATLTRTKNQCPSSSWCNHYATPSRFGGLRPFGVSFLFGGWDKNFGFQLCMSDPSGNYGGWKAAAIGANNPAAQSMLKQDYKDDINREEATELALKVLSKTMDSTSLTSEKLELAEVFLTPSGKVKYQVHSPESVSKLL
ncbi:Proteasome subunit alpha type-4-like protein, partial [Drosera capensis]